jgi:hypothetical protein
MLAGLLLISGTVTGVIAAVLTQPILSAPDYLAQAAAHPQAINLAAFLCFLMAVSCAGVGLAMYPILKPYSEGLAVSVVAFRTIEGVIQVLGSAALVSLLIVGQAQAGGPADSVTGALVKGANDWLGNGPMLLFWCIAAAMYYAVFYHHRLAPRWLSLWGLVGIGLTSVACVLVMLGALEPFGTVQSVANAPIMLQEMVFAGWLIAKGVRQAQTTGWQAAPVATRA